MGWFASIVVGLITAAATMLAAGYVANLAAGWYRVTSFEGASGYFVVGLALVGLIVGLIIGLVAARYVAGSADPGFLKALGLALAVALGAVALVGGVARLNADVSPRFRGQEVTLAVEFRWPEGQEPPPAADSVEWFLRLSAASGRTLRASHTGPLWREDARLEDGRWIVPGAVDLFTGRGDRVIDVAPQGVIPNGFIIPLPGRPGAAHLAWSEWLPRPREGLPAAAGGITYRFRVVPQDQAVRTEAFGPFEVMTYARGLGETTIANQPPRWTADAEFAVRHRGEPLVIVHADSGGATQRLERVSAVAAVTGPAPALMVQVEERQGFGTCYLVVSEPDRVRIERAGYCDSPRMLVAPLTDDPVVFRRGLEERLPAGRFDRASFGLSRWYLLGEKVLDREALTLRPWSPGDQPGLIERIPPVDVAPDGQSFVRLAWGEDSSSDFVLAVTRIGGGEPYVLPVDPTRMRYGDVDQVDPAWVRHHFEWQRTPGAPDRLVARSAFQPLPWRGTLTLDRSGYREYRVMRASEALREALIDFLVAELNAERLPEGGISPDVRIGQAGVHVSFSESDGHLGVWMDRGTDSGLVVTIAQAFDAALATHRYDHLFAR